MDQRALHLLQDALSQFIRRELIRALGPDFADDFAPPRTTPVALLDFIEQKWLGVFNDTLTDADRRSLRHTCTVLKSTMHNPDSEQVAKAVEGALVAIGASGKAATVAYGDYGQLKTPRRRQPPPPSVQDDPMQDARPSAPSEPNSDASMLDVEEVLPPGRSGLVPVVLDGANIGWGADMHTEGFQMRRAATALAYFQRLGHPCTLVLPASRLRAGAGDDAEARTWVLQHRGTPSLVATPDADYDDVYITHLARRHAAVVVSNDKFRDVVYQAEADGAAAAEGWRQYLAACRCSFAFHGNAFVPNPAFCFARAAGHAGKYALTPD